MRSSASWSDARLAALLSAALFVLAAWPLALVDVPPLQDLPNHLASVSVIEHLSQYPQFVFNGFFKTNSALTAWLLFVGPALGLRFAAKLFVLVVLGLGAFAYPRFVLAFGGRSRMVLSTLFVAPMVHDWFVSTGMLDFALAVPLTTWLFVLLKGQLDRPSMARGMGILLVSCLTWYAHPFPLIVLYLLAALHVLTMGGSWGPRWIAARWFALPLVPSSALVASSLWVHAMEPKGAMTGFVELGRSLPVWELAYNLWAEWTWGFTKLELGTLVPCVVLAAWAVARWRSSVPFGRCALVALVILYVLTPYTATNWFHVNSRFIPFLWLAALTRLPEQLPRRWMTPLLAACVLTSSVGMGIDYVRLDRECHRFTAGMSAVPAGAKLLPLIFRSKITSENTRNLLHAWGYYVVEKHTTAPLLFAHSRSFAVFYKEPPDPMLNHLVLEGFAPNMADVPKMCDGMRWAGVPVRDCEAEWRLRWREFWDVAEPRFDHVLLWDAPPGIMGVLPPEYRVVFQRDELTIVARE